MSKTIAITGACSGLGLEFVKQYIALGNKVIAIDMNGGELVRLEQEYPDNFKGKKADLLAIEDYSEFITSFLAEFGPIDLFINNAGIVKVGAFDSVDEADFDRVMKLNFSVMAKFTHYLIGHMEERGSGSIMNVASVAGHVPCPFTASYSASKFAIVGLTKSLQIELEYRKSPVQLQLVSPGFVKTSLHKNQDLGVFAAGFEKMAESASKCVSEVIKKQEKGDDFIAPTLNGTLMLKIDWLSPKISKFMSRVISSKNYKQMLGLEKIDKL
ncbi:hypothetical protein A9Q84_15430 [Halobacteriovorax marinus]|mgnify:CR=1 FL=1|uniref:Short-chain dehydrogenase n=1 Tax=Halobacteriovorax marinus TaxID=97084 RepID=A0A1Y5FA90_9BACT|nr:hypothetical protein A9Q84_15430 [Halobacteriovorax marinus]